MTGRGRNPRTLAAATGAVLGTAGAGAAAVAGAASWSVPLIGLAIAVLTWGTYTAVDHLDGASGPAPAPAPFPSPAPTPFPSPTEPSSGPGAAPSVSPSSPGSGLQLPADTRPWLARASEAAAKLDRHRHRGDATDPTLTQALGNASERIRSAEERLRARAAAVALIDATTAGTDREALRLDEQRLKKEAAAHADGPVREAKRASARAVAERRDSLTRLAELRDLMTATIETTALRLEAAAERGSMFVSLRAADEAGTRPLDLTALGDELEAVQAGLDKLDEIACLLDGEAP
ncbi:hypothetical protein [Streptomyces sp. NPDC058486]|uniref:hypothetical protein n=1 Tax=unclassified Streptomyces TaxID=2593676 RepID=UPI003667C7BD